MPPTPSTIFHGCWATVSNRGPTSLSSGPARFHTTLRTGGSRKAPAMMIAAAATASTAARGGAKEKSCWVPAATPKPSSRRMCTRKAATCETPMLAVASAG